MPVRLADPSSPQESTLQSTCDHSSRTGRHAARGGVNMAGKGDITPAGPSRSAARKRNCVAELPEVSRMTPVSRSGPKSAGVDKVSLARPERRRESSAKQVSPEKPLHQKRVLRVRRGQGQTQFIRRRQGVRRDHLRVGLAALAAQSGRSRIAGHENSWSRQDHLLRSQPRVLK